MADVKIKYHDIPNHRMGETFNGVSFLNLTVDGVPIDLNGYTIEADFRLTKNGALQQRWSTVGSSPKIEILQPTTNGCFNFKNDFIVDLDAGKYYYDIRFVSPDGRVEYYVEGTFTVDQNVTRG